MPRKNWGSITLRLLLLSGLLLQGCESGQEAPATERAGTEAIGEGNVRIGAFNMENFGSTKSSDPALVARYAAIVMQYDALVLQEIEDVSGEAPQILLTEVNRRSTARYALALSPRLGRTSAKEQYGLIYRPDRISLLSSLQLADPEDEFEREPHVFHVRHGNDSFGLIALHAKPGDAPAEVNAAAFAYDAFRNDSGESNAFIVGDLNADCDYASDDALRATALCADTRFSWLIPDTADTTTGATHCAYDRIVVRGTIAKRLAVPAVYRFDQALGIPGASLSDHFPVEVEVGSSGGDYTGFTCVGAPSVSVLERGIDHSPGPPPPSAPSCCRVCSAGKACGDSCIARDSPCQVDTGCACNG